MCARKRTAGKQGSGRKNPHKSGRRHGTRAGNKATERGRTSGKSRTQPPGGGSVGQTKNGGQPAGWEQGSDTPAEKTPEHRSQKPPQQRSAAQERPARHMARRAGRRKNLRTGKIRVRSFACPEGPCEPGPPKNASLFWLAQSFLLRIARSAEQKGAPPPFIPCKPFEKSLTKNFHVGQGVSQQREKSCNQQRCRAHGAQHRHCAPHAAAASVSHGRTAPRPSPWPRRRRRRRASRSPLTPAGAPRRKPAHPAGRSGRRASRTSAHGPPSAHAARSAHAAGAAARPSHSTWSRHPVSSFPHSEFLSLIIRQKTCYANP